MPTLTATLLTIVPLALFGAVTLGLRETPSRSLAADRFARPSRLSLKAFAVLILVAAVIAIHSPTRPDLFALGVVAGALLGSLYVERKLRVTVEYATRYYLDPLSWQWPSPRGDHWRYEMQHIYLTDPEYLDSMILSMLRTHRCRADFEAALDAEKFPRRYKPLLSKRLWGPIFPSLRTIAMDSVPNTILKNVGRFTSNRSADQVYDELRVLALTDQTLFLDRWQYYWGLRNINVVDQLLNRTFGAWTQIGVIAVGMAFFALGTSITETHGGALAPSLAAIASGSLLWMLITCGASSLLIVGAFRGTGTFTISYPCPGDAFDPLWGLVIQVGIVSFTVSFVIYGLATPFLFESASLEHFHLDIQFALFAMGSLLFCASVFSGHVAGVHRLMSRSRENALARIGDALGVARTASRRQMLLDRFADVQRLRTWPLRGSVIAQTAAGIALPILIQVILLYTGLRTK